MFRENKSEMVDGRALDINRRRLLRQMVALPAILAVSGVVAACGGRPERPENAPSTTTESAGDGSAQEVACADGESLSPQDRVMRRALSYADQSDGERPCLTCIHFTAADGGTCGGCTILKGPIAANGTCTAWSVNG